ncbi:Rne/Rng family ribonuclease [Clostridium sp. JNZ X4-2]
MKEIFVERNTGLLRIAIKEGEVLKECLMEEQNGSAYPGEIYSGVVRNIVPAIKCAFIDIGCSKNAYMYMDNKFRNLNLKKGEKVLVQVVKESYGKKGAKVVKNISIPGKYCVLDDFIRNIQFSKKINDISFKRHTADNIKVPEGVGLMVRTDAQNVDSGIIANEMSKLYECYMDIKKRAQYSLKPALIFESGGILGETLRDKLNHDNFKIYVNNKKDYVYIEEFLKCVSNVDVELVLHREKVNLFSYYDLEKKILRLRNSRVELNCGGYIIIDRTEAMFVIDVNSGKNVKNNTMDKTVLATNLQAAEEIARQIILRNLNGIILIDFIDMDEEENREKVLSRLKCGFLNDKNKTVIYDFTQLNLVQIARKRKGKPIYDYIEENCTYCSGTGKKIKLSYMELLIGDEILNINREENIKNIHIQMGLCYKKDVDKDVKEFVKKIGAENMAVYITYDEKLSYKLEPLVFDSQLQDLKMFKVN